MVLFKIILAIAQIVCTRDFSVFGWVTMDGCAYVAVRMASSDSTVPDAWTGTCIYETNPAFAPATTIDFNPSFSLISIGNILYILNLR